MRGSSIDDLPEVRGYEVEQRVQRGSVKDEVEQHDHVRCGSLFGVTTLASVRMPSV
jgi:hypothetical protein